MCDMTYMFEYPEYLKIPLKYEVASKFPRYSLYIYGEGKYAESLKAGNIQGNPVLFVPGNAGSHRQVRSLASVALRMGKSLQLHMHFNFYSINFNEEISGLYGGVLNDQMEFLHECVKHIQSLYPSKKKLILIGHSMGGMIARAVFSIPKFDSSAISLILTLATPHKEPVIALDSGIVDFYQKTKETWKYRLKTELRDIPLISIGGGQRDFLVRSDLTSLNFQHKNLMDIHCLTPAIPGVWVSTDHLAIVWCKQLILTICRSFYDLYNERNKQINISESETEMILRHHYVSRYAGTHISQVPYIPFTTFPRSGQWIEMKFNAWRFSRNKVLSDVYLLVPLSLDGDIIIVASGLAKKDWIFGCTKQSANSETCTEAENLSERGEIIPSRKKNVERRFIHLSREYLYVKKYFYLVVYVSPVKNQVEILGERYNSNERTKFATLPSLLQRPFTFTPVRILSISLVEPVIFYNITIPKSAGIFEATEFQLETRLCKAGSFVGQGIIKMHIPSSNEVSFYHIGTSLGGLTVIPTRVNLLPSEVRNRNVNLQLILDPGCSVVLSATFPLSHVASQFVKFYGTYIVGYTVALLLTFLAGQMKYIGSLGTISPFYKIFGQYPTFLTLVAVPSLLFHCIWAQGYYLPLFPHPDDIAIWDKSLLSAFLLRTLLYLISCGLIVTVYILMEVFMKFFSNFWIWIRHRNILNATEIPLEQTLKGPVRISKLMVIWSSFLAATALVFSGSLACIFAVVFHLCKVLTMHARCKAEEERRGSNLGTSRWYFHFTLLLLWILVTVLVSPSFISWLKSLEYSLRVPNDPYCLPCLLLIVSSSFLWQLPTPCLNRQRNVC
ncbi:GPI inositol-deacylase-like isoform X2 [Stegodyphus dumicola]|uniref:GPI inositol-deacylase-like isoform X2 n=2 Tax=Stegodyphus dumicola TaxID=202533 RepID=UPI0015B31E5A|nr:GPI inositol-deacylase-like isoform X2 [Stegodyphus dumicola]